MNTEAIRRFIQIQGMLFGLTALAAIAAAGYPEPETPLAPRNR